MGNEPDDFYRGGGRAIETGEDLVGLGLECVAGEDGDGLAESYVAGGFAAAQVVVIEGGQIVVDERVGVQHFEGCAQLFNSCGDGSGDGDGGLDGKHWPETLAASEDRVTHRAVNGGRDGLDRGDQRFERLIGQFGAFFYERLHIGF